MDVDEILNELQAKTDDLEAFAEKYNVSVIFHGVHKKAFAGAIVGIHGELVDSLAAAILERPEYGIIFLEALAKSRRLMKIETEEEE